MVSSNKTAQHGHIGRFLPAIKNSIKGLRAAYINEIAFRQYCWVACILLPTAFYISENFSEFAVLVLSVFVVLIAELLNTAVEAAIDRIGIEHHELSGLAKDLGSAGVFIALAAVVVIWGYKIVQLVLV